MRTALIIFQEYCSLPGNLYILPNGVMSFVLCFCIDYLPSLAAFERVTKCNDCECSATTTRLCNTFLTPVFLNQGCYTWWHDSTFFDTLFSLQAVPILPYTLLLKFLQTYLDTYFPLSNPLGRPTNISMPRSCLAYLQWKNLFY